MTQKYVKIHVTFLTIPILCVTSIFHECLIYMDFSFASRCIYLVIPSFEVTS